MSNGPSPQHPESIAPEPITAPLRVLRYYPRARIGDGGITNSLKRMAAETAAAGARVTVAFDGAAPGDDDDPFTWVGLRHVGTRRWRRPVGLGALLQDTDLLVLHSAWTLHNAHAAAAARRLGVPYLLEPRGAYDPLILSRRAALKKSFWAAFERGVVHGAAAIHIFFEEEREHLAALGYHGPTVVAPNGVLPPTDVAWDGGSGDYVLWIGRFDPEHKGLDLLLEGMRALPPASRPRLRLHGPDWAGGKARVVDMVRELELGSWVHVGEPVYGERKWELVRSATAFTYPSRWEGFGNSAAEAVVVGVPTLVTPYPFGRWLAERGVAVLAERTPEDVARGLLEVTGPAAAAMSARGRELLRTELSWQAVARSWLRQARQVLG